MESDVHFIMSAMDTICVAASAATILQTALALAPPGRRRWSGRRERERAYLNFQRAALDVGTCCGSRGEHGPCSVSELRKRTCRRPPGESHYLPATAIGSYKTDYYTPDN
jgi:hypothetical protein